MATTLTPATTGLKPARLGGWGNGRRGETYDGGHGHGPAGLPQSHMLGMGFALAAVGMLFCGLTSSYVVRQGTGADWKAIAMPAILPLNTVILVLSSLALERARHWWKRTAGSRAATRWLAFTVLLGAGFLTGQLVAWQGLAQQGIYLSSNPHSSFFYLLTGLHAVHVLGGLLGLASVKLRPPARQLRWFQAGALYWHFMGALWVYLLVLLFV